LGDDFIKIPPGPSHGGDIEAQVRALNDHVHHAIVAWRTVNNMLATIRTSVNNLEHNDLEGLQGGVAGQYYHLTTAQLAQIVALSTTYQPLDSDLTAIAALTTATFGRSLLTQGSATAARATLGAAGTSFSWFISFGNRPNNSTAGTLAAADGSISDATDMDGHVIGRNMADVARTDLSFMFVVPEELDVTAAITARAYYRLAAAGTSRNVEIEITARVAGDTDVTVSGGTQFDIASAKSVNAYASGALVVHNLGTVFGANTLATRSIIHGTVFRDAQAGNADDDFANTINFLAVQFIGTRVTT